MADLGVQFAGIHFRNPVLLASGTCGYGKELQPLADLSRVGGLVSKTITPEPRAGNRPPRIVETPAGMLNSIGLQNPGLEGFIRDQWPFLSGLDTRVVVNIAAPTAEQHGEMAARLEALSGIAALEVNISSPNMKDGGMLFGCNPAAAAEVIGAVRRVTRLPVIAKLTPNVTDIATVARAVEEAGADGISLINTLLGMAIDVERRRPVLGNITGGLSGPAIKPVALAMVWKVRRAVKLPLMGLGGISTTADALEFILAGATAVQVGTATFFNPGAAVEITQGLDAYCQRHGVGRLASLVGVAQV
ncbi:MAG: dihydroorotate dehydrogenase [Candidatus Handelsmanbacteria bacterium]|nr:dihydroorotate dehydrogenase [Candidatus Handelsmanbacteria bacterium]